MKLKKACKGLRARGGLKMCKHEKWLYVPSSDGRFSIDDENFLCAECGQWIQIGIIDVEKIINVKHLPKDSCLHDINYFTIGRYYLCLRCGYGWVRELPRLDIKADSFDWKEWDRQRREKALERFRNGEVL